MKIYCKHCHKPLGELSLEIFARLYDGILIEGGKKIFCSEKCYSKYLDKYLVEEYNKNKIYWIFEGNQKCYIPYPGCRYKFESVEGCRNRIDASGIGFY